MFYITFRNASAVKVELFVLDLVDSSAPIGQYSLDYNATTNHPAHDTTANPGHGRVKWWTMADGYTGDENELDVDTTTATIDVTAGDPL